MILRTVNYSANFMHGWIDKISAQLVNAVQYANHEIPEDGRKYRLRCITITTGILWWKQQTVLHEILIRAGGTSTDMHGEVYHEYDKVYITDSPWDDGLYTEPQVLSFLAGCKHGLSTAAVNNGEVNATKVELADTKTELDRITAEYKALISSNAGLNNKIKWLENEAAKLEPRLNAPLNHLSSVVHHANQKWWTDLQTGKRLSTCDTLEHKAMKICLMHSELSECLEGTRKNLRDTHLPQFKMEYVELIDCIIRILDYAGAYGIDLDTVFREKMEYNATREDHKIENRIKEGGKKI